MTRNEELYFGEITKNILELIVLFFDQRDRFLSRLEQFIYSYLLCQLTLFAKDKGHIGSNKQCGHVHSFKQNQITSIKLYFNFPN